jgi:hypothetical protein
MECLVSLLFVLLFPSIVHEKYYPATLHAFWPRHRFTFLIVSNYQSLVLFAQCWIFIHSFIELSYLYRRLCLTNTVFLQTMVYTISNGAAQVHKHYSYN